MNIKNLTIVALVLAGMSLAGCSEQQQKSTEEFFKTGKYRFIDPSKVIAKPATPQVSPIRSSVTDLDFTSAIYPNAVRPTPEMWTYSDTDYRMGPSDVLDISILDLYAAGMETTLRKEISESGYIDLPQLRSRILADDLTEAELKKVIEKAYQEAGILRDPVVSVSIVARRQQTFSVLGAVMRPGTYNLVRRDMRVLDALALAGGKSQTGIEWIYVIRQAPPQKQSEIKSGAVRPLKLKSTETPATSAPKNGSQERKQLENLLGQTPMPLRTLSGGMTHFAEAGSGEEAPTSLAANGAASSPTKEPQFRWVYRDGKWVKVSSEEANKVPMTQPLNVKKPAAGSVVSSRPASRPVTSRPDDPFGWSQIAMEDMVQVVAINVDKLIKEGDYRMNIVIRENDVIHVPPIEMGEFYIMGEVLRPGVYSLTGRKVTLKMALAASGNLGPLAWPENSILIRRVGKNQEQTIPLNLERILRGEDADIYLRKDDVVAVGTAWQCSFLAVIRNAFRMTYGFGFIYDRNFADPLEVTGGYNSDRFTHW